MYHTAKAKVFENERSIYAKLAKFKLKVAVAFLHIRVASSNVDIFFLSSDADECALFGEEVCKGGYCLDTVGSFECYCKAGQDYDSTKLECRG